jgi:hypothetical protein
MRVTQSMRCLIRFCLVALSFMALVVSGCRTLVAVTHVDEGIAYRLLYFDIMA